MRLQVASVVGALGISLIVTLQPAYGRQESGTFERYTYSNDEGSLDYMVYVPPHPPKSGGLLVVYMPGAGQTAEQAAHDTEFNKFAADDRFFVLYPEADITNDGYFHYMEREHQHRGKGEPSIIAGMTRKVIRDWSIDRSRVHVGGMSNGAAMANVMITTYPDVYSTVFAHSGCAYRGQCDAGLGSNVSAKESARAIRKEMGKRARVVPFIVFQGTDDQPVPPYLSKRTVKSWLLANDFADDGRANLSIPLKPNSVIEDQVPKGHPYTVSSYVDRKNCVLGQYWLIEDMRHAYSGGAPNNPQGVAVDPDSERKASAAATDPLGPKATAAAFDFFAGHPRDASNMSC